MHESRLPCCRVSTSEAVGPSVETPPWGPKVPSATGSDGSCVSDVGGPSSLVRETL